MHIFYICIYMPLVLCLYQKKNIFYLCTLFYNIYIYVCRYHQRIVITIEKFLFFFQIKKAQMSWKAKLFTWRSAFLFSGFAASMAGATIFARRIPNVISLNKEEVMEKRRHARKMKELEDKHPR